MNHQDPTTRRAESALDISIVIPCLNEAKTIGAVVEKALRSIERLGLRGEVLVSDNGSTDGSVAIAEALGARIVHAPDRGYGNALRHGMSVARGWMLVMGDADDTYDFGEIDLFVRAMDDGADVVMGTRLPPGRILPGANPLLNRYVGTPVLTFVLNRLFGTSIRDTNCGMRGLTRACFERLDLQADGMEFASEMVIKAGLHGVRLAEVPVTLHPDRRGRPPHLRPWRDGWRHLEFMLLHARPTSCSSSRAWRRSRSACSLPFPSPSGPSTCSADCSTSTTCSTAARS
jgi:glycosyltransferase involved in cell wall biosynthesis